MNTQISQHLWKEGAFALLGLLCTFVSQPRGLHKFLKKQFKCCPNQNRGQHILLDWCILKIDEIPKNWFSSFF
jgi:hypothetical protein